MEQTLLNLFKGKKVTIMGLGLLGKGIGDAKFLAECGAEVLVTDLKTKEQLQSSLDILKEYSNITYILGEHRLEDFRNRDFIIKGGDVPPNSPYILEARKFNTPIEMDVSLFAKYTSATLVGITGTRGKSTTTQAIYEVLNTYYTKGKVFLGGNVRGMATLPLLAEAKAGDIVVLELDSWQLYGFGEAKISPHVAVFTNFLKDHLNYYLKVDPTEAGAEALYFKDKAAIFANQKAGDYLITHPQIIDRIKREYPVVPSTIIAADKTDLSRGITLQIPGDHNRDNMALAQETLKVLGLSDQQIATGLSEYKGMPGRLEFIREINGVKIYNDTTATTPDGVVAALKGLSTNKNVILIFGGADKGIDMTPVLTAITDYAKVAILLSAPGKTSGSDRIQKDFEQLTITKDTAENLTVALSKALAQAQSGDSIVLSPAFASFGMFKNEYDRGDQFTEIVKSL